MFNFKVLFAALSIATGIASAAMPSWTIPGIPTDVKIGPTYTLVNGIIKEEANPTIIIVVDGKIFVATYSGAKNKEFYELAKMAFITGKKIKIYHDSNSLQNFVSCGDYDGDKCVYMNSNTPFARIQELALTN